MTKTKENKAVETATTKKAGRPVIQGIAGYKVKVGLRYATESGPMANSLAGGTVFPSKEAAQVRVKELVKEGQIRLWGGRTRERFIPNKGTKL